MTIDKDSESEADIIIPFTWDMISTDATGFVIQLYFEDPTQISHSSS